MNTDEMIGNTAALKDRIRQQLTVFGLQNGMGNKVLSFRERRSAVLVALTERFFTNSGFPSEPCLILNKRSQKVRQPGDLCYPGGGIGLFDQAFSILLGLPGFPLAAYTPKKQWRRHPKRSLKRLSVLLATSLREAWEEMRLNPMDVTFLGPLPAQKLVMFERVIHPLVGWVRSGKKLRPNWEVERIVYIPIRNLLDHQNYGHLNLSISGTGGDNTNQHFSCFFHRDENGQETLWGASFRITMDFLRLVFDFQPPDTKDLPMINGRLNQTYLSGSRYDFKRQGG